MHELAVTAVGRDRPGIVAGLTHALLPLGANLHDSRAALLRGTFAMVMAIAVPDEVTRDDVAGALAPTATELGLDVHVGDAPDLPSDLSGERCVISVYGADHPGIVHAVSHALSEHGVNIVDLSSRVVGDPAVYVLGIAAQLPTELTIERLTAILTPVAAAQLVELHVERESDEVL